MFKSVLINDILKAFPIQEQEDVLNRIGYNLIQKVEELQSELESLDVLTRDNSNKKLKDFSKSMIIRKIGLLLSELSLVIIVI